MDEEKDLEVPAAIPPAGTENAPERKNRRWIIFGAAAVAVAVWSPAACADTVRTRDTRRRWRATHASRPWRT